MTGPDADLAVIPSLRAAEQLIREIEEFLAARDGDLALDLFAGPGGWDQGARVAGWVGALLGIEWDADACATGEAAGHARLRADVARVPAELFAGLVHLLLASPPCPSFSAAGYGGGRHLLALLCQAITEALQGRAQLGRTRRDCTRVLRDVAAHHPKLSRLPRAERSAWARRQAEMSVLSVQPARFVHAVRPRRIALEQVPEVLPLWRHMAAMLAGLGYRTWCGVLSSEQYGVPQTRKRAVLVASLDGPVGPPAPTHQAYRAGRAVQVEPDLFGDPLPAPVSMAEALGWAAGVEQREVRGAGMVARHGDRPGRQIDEPSRTITSGARGGPALQWVRTGNNSRAAGGTTRDYERPTDAPAPTLTGNVNRWQLRNGAQPNAAHRDPDQPAPTIYSSRTTNLSWVLRSNYGTSGDPADRGERTPDQPAPTVTSKVNRAMWVHERPATTVCGDPRIGRPGHKDRDQGEAQFAADSVRVSVQEAGVLQSFPVGYPWCGTSSKQYLQVGNAVPPLLAAAVVGPLIADGASRAGAA